MRNIKDFFCKPFKKNAFNITLRQIFVAGILLYIMLMTFFMPTLTAYAETINDDNAATETRDNSLEGDARDIEDYGNSEAGIEDYGNNDSVNDVSENTEGIQDNYTNSWDQDYNSNVTVVREDTGKRTAKDKHFLMSDGSYTLMSYAQDIHYIVNDKYEEIDNSLEKSGNVYKNKSNVLQVEIPDTYTADSKTSISMGDYQLSFKMQGYNAIKNAKISNDKNKQIVDKKESYEFELKNQSTANYIFDDSNVELQQILMGTSFKENIIINAPLDLYCFTFEVKTKNLILNLSDNGNIYASNNIGERVLTIPKGYMFDANNVHSDNVDYKLIQKGDVYILTIMPDIKWISSSDRIFPITIDPTIDVSSASFKSAYRGGTSATTALPVKAGAEGYMSFDLPTLPKGATVTYAELAITSTNSTTYALPLYVWENDRTLTDSNGDGVIDAPPFISTTGENGEINYLHYYDDPNTEYKPEQHLNIEGQSQRYYIDITRNLKFAFDFEYPFYGFVFQNKSNEIIYIATETHTYQSYRPLVSIVYRQNLGIEGYWDYDNYSIGSDNVYINKYNDQLTNIHEAAQFDWALPVSIQFVFLEAYKDQNYNVDGVFNNVYYGLGWKLNYQQVIRCRNADFEYYDADGTMHYFKYDPEKGYTEDEDGLGLILYSWSGTRFKMVDKQHNEYSFDNHGRLFRIEDANNNITNILYGDGNSPTDPGLPLTEINDNNGHRITFSYSGGYLQSIDYKQDDGITRASVIVNYDGNNRISKITNADGTFSEYTYKANNRLNRIKDANLYNIKLDKDAILTPYSELNPVTMKSNLFSGLVATRSVYEAMGINIADSEWIHIKDNIYCNGMTIEVIKNEGEDYFPYTGFSVIKDNISEWATHNPLLVLAIIPLLIHAVNVKTEWKPGCDAYFKSNYQTQCVYDRYGCLVSSYVSEESSSSGTESRYERPEGTVNLNNNKTKQSASYYSGTMNYINNGSFENALTNWGTLTDPTTYGYNGVTDKFSVSGKNSAEIMISQPIEGRYGLYQGFTDFPVGKYTFSAEIKVSDLLVPYSIDTSYGALLQVRVNGSYKSSCYINTTSYTSNNGFQKVYLNFEITTPSEVYAYLMLRNCSGFAYFDNVQLTRSEYGISDNYNYAENSGFEKWTSGAALPQGWTYNSNTGLPANTYVSKLDSASTFSGSSGVKLSGMLSGYGNFRYDIPIDLTSQSIAYTMSLWVNNLGRMYRPSISSSMSIVYRVLDINGNDLTDYVGVSITQSFAVWHQITATVVAPPNSRYIEYNVQINLSDSILYLDNFSLVKSKIINLVYDNNGNNTVYNDGNKEYTYTENNENITVGIDGNSEYGIVKDSKGNVLSSTDLQRGVKTQYVYDGNGRPVTTAYSDLNNTKRIISETQYTSNNNGVYNVVKDIDGLGFSSEAEYYSWSGLQKRIKNNDKSYLKYEYGYNTSNKNLLNIAAPYKAWGDASFTQINEDSFRISNQGQPSSSTPLVNYRIFLEPNTDYNLSFTYEYLTNRVGGATVYVRSFDDNWSNDTTIFDFTSLVGNITSASLSDTFNSGSRSRFDIIFYSGGNNTGTARECIFSNVQLELGNRQTAYESFGANAVNLFDHTQVAKVQGNAAYTKINDSSFYISNPAESSGSTPYVEYHFVLNKNAYYTLTANHLYNIPYTAGSTILIRRCDDSWSHVSYQGQFNAANGLQSITFNTEGYTNYKILFYSGGNHTGTAGKCEFSNVQLELGNLQTDYEYYGTYAGNLFDHKQVAQVQGKAAYTKINEISFFISNPADSYSTPYVEYHFVLNKNTYYTLTANHLYDIPYTSGSTILIRRCDDSWAHVSYQGQFNAANGLQSITFNTEGYSNYKIFFYSGGNHTGTAGKCTYTNVQLELGCFSTPYKQNTADYSYHNLSVNTENLADICYTPYYGGTWDSEINTVSETSYNDGYTATTKYRYFTVSDSRLAADGSYQPIGALQSVTTESGTVYSYVYDKWGNITKVCLNGIDQIFYEYDKEGKLIRKTIGGAGGYTEYYYYDISGRQKELRTTTSPNADAAILADENLSEHVYYEYTASGNIIKICDTKQDKGYWYQYDANNRLILKGEGAFTDSDINASISTKTVFENVYDNYGEISWTKTISLDGVKSTYGISVTAIVLTGTFSRTYTPNFEIIKVDGVEKIKLKYDRGLYLLREDNVFLNKSIVYTRDAFGAITSVLVGNYTTSTVSGTSYTPFFSEKTTRSDYDYGVDNAWDSTWTLNNQHILNTSYITATAQPNEIFNGVTITDIIRIIPADFYTSDKGYHSLVSPELLIYGGDCIELSYMVKRIAPVSTNSVSSLLFKYSDGTTSGRHILTYTTDWQSYSATSIVGKVVVAIELEWYNGESLHLGNVVLTTQSAGRIDGRLAGETQFNNDYSKYDYDELGRLYEISVKDTKTSSTEYLNETYTYLDGENGITTDVITSKAVTTNSSSCNVTYNYEYNRSNVALGAEELERSYPYNIWKVKEGTTEKIEYYYDSFGRVIRENNAYLPAAQGTVFYSYDDNSNILSKTVYAFTAGNGALSGGTAKLYTYGDTAFGDRLTGYNGQTIAYDGDASGGMGFPTTYLGKTMTWTGRNLSSVVSGGNTYTYKYDASGQRLSKSGGTVAEYLYNGSNLIREKRGSDVIWYIYNQSGIIGLTLNGTTYYYIRNLQGDVTKIVNASGNIVVEYSYDSWGKVLSTTGTLAASVGANNPFRYRGYYYDTETNLYYLNSRYYDPETGRFISPDVVAEGGNLYTYCQNDPINYYDATGYFAIPLALGLSALAIKVLIGIVVVTTVVTTVGVVESETHIFSNSLTNIANGIENLWDGIGEKSGEATLPTLGVQTPSMPYNPSMTSMGNLLSNSFADSETDSQRISFYKRKTPAQRNKFKSRKKAKEAAKKAGGGKEPINHPNGHEKNSKPHFHPNVSGPEGHDHYYYPCIIFLDIILNWREL